MRCYNCGVEISDSNVCSKCGADVTVYKKTALASNVYYNRGLEKAKVRDLSGAVDCLKISISINKRNIDARNVLGLVYCEMGDVVEALSQWVISKNILTDNNPADKYIKNIQSDQNRFEIISNSIKKYNQALIYVNEKNYDMAIIQLKKVIAQNPNMIRAMQLLSLLLIKDNDLSKAKKYLNMIKRIDCNNTKAMRYIKEVQQLTQQNGRFLPKTNKNDMESRVLNGNDVIIPRTPYKDPGNGGINIINLLVGVLLGAALIWFLIMPAKYKGLTKEYNDSIAEYSEQLSSGNVELNSLTEELNTIKQQKQTLEEQIEELKGKGGSNELLGSIINAANFYVANDKTSAAGQLVNIDVNALPTNEAKNLYNTLLTNSAALASVDFFNRGIADYNKSAFETAAVNFVNSYKCDKLRVDSLYFAGKSYEALNQVENAKLYFGYIVNDFSSSIYTAEARSYINSH